MFIFEIGELADKKFYWMKLTVQKNEISILSKLKKQLDL